MPQIGPPLVNVPLSHCQSPEPRHQRSTPGRLEIPAQIDVASLGVRVIVWPADSLGQKSRQPTFSCHPLAVTSVPARVMYTTVTVLYTQNGVPSTKNCYHIARDLSQHRLDFTNVQAVWRHTAYAQPGKMPYRRGRILGIADLRGRITLC